MILLSVCSCLFQRWSCPMPWVITVRNQWIWLMELKYFSSMAGSTWLDDAVSTWLVEAVLSIQEGSRRCPMIVTWSGIQTLES